MRKLSDDDLLEPFFTREELLESELAELGEARQQTKLANQNQDTLKRLEGVLSLANMTAGRAEGAKDMLQEQLMLARSATEIANAEVTQLRTTSAELSQQLTDARKALTLGESTEPDNGD